MANITSKTIKEGIKSNGYTSQKLGFDNRRPFNLGLSSQKSESSPFKATEGQYWYKIGGKSVTKKEYNAYENPVGDGPTKSTNDPDASGRKAQIQAAREKLPRPSTVLTEAQMKVKDQGTKIKKKPPFKKKKKKSPMKNKFLNRLQTGLTVAGTTPWFGNIADGANAMISGGRAAYHKYKGDDKAAKKHLKNAAVNAAMMIPGVGQGIASTKLAAAAGKAGSKIASKVGGKAASKVGEKVAKKVVAKGVNKSVKKGLETTPQNKASDGKIYAEKRKGNKIVSKNIA
jgi:hypothetical protein